MNGLTVCVTRGDRVESRHVVDAAVVDADGGLVFGAGPVDEAHFPRSAIKALLALPLVETGIATRLGLDDRALALASASHDGSPEHVALARSMLEAGGRDAGDLACGTHWPLSRDAAHALARAGQTPCPLHNNCSGKHAGLICLAVGLGLDPAGYQDAAHPAMREATASLARETGARCDERNAAVDGCSIPTYAIPLASLARGFARFGTGHGMTPARAEAARRIRHAVASSPDLVSGAGRFDTVLNAGLGPGAFVKGGAEGIWCASLPGEGLGLAVKARDGAGRAAQAAMAALLARFGVDHPALHDWPGRAIVTWRGAPAGTVLVETALGDRIG